MKPFFRKTVATGFVVAAMAAATPAQQPKSSSRVSPSSEERTPPDAATDPSGMYSFLREGEFVQLTFEEGKLSGFISRFGETQSDQGEFIDQFFDKAALHDDRISFTTKPVHGVSYQFSGVLRKVAGKRPGAEGYRVMKGTLVEHTTDANGEEKARQHEVEFKSFPQDLSKP
jgi:hypothetical protein